MHQTVVSIFRRLRSTGPVFRHGLAINLLVNSALVAVTILAYQFANEIPLVADSPSRFSVLIVPLLLGALVAAALSFLNYFSLPGWQRAFPIAGMILVGHTLNLIVFDNFGDGSTSHLLDAYTARLDRIGSLILVFSILTMCCSGLKICETRTLPSERRGQSAESDPAYWILKMLVGDLPIVISALFVIKLQELCADCSHQNYTNVYVTILKGASGAISRNVDSLHLLEIQRQLSVANFWTGVSLGVTGVQLVMQQISSLSLDFAFLLRSKLSQRRFVESSRDLSDKARDQVSGKAITQ